MKSAWQLAFGLVIGFLAAGVLFLITRPPRGNPVILQPIPTPLPVIVHVSGEVLQPGVYSLPPGSRVQEAVVAAGGFTAAAQQENLNLASPLEDGMQLHVPASGEPTLTLQTGNRSTVILININTASDSELEKLPRIGPELARRIITYRQQHGPFESTDAIMFVEGIGEGIFAEIQELITVDAP